MEIAPRCDAIVVIGSANSSNTLALEKPGPRGRAARGCYRVNGADELPDDLSGIVGVTAGASAPEELVEAVHRPPRPGRTASRRSRITDEDEYFPPPRNLRDLLAAVDVLATFAARRLGARPPRRSTTAQLARQRRPRRPLALTARRRRVQYWRPWLTTFTRMDESTAEQWAVIGAETAKNQGRVAERVLGMLRSLADITDGFATDQLTHCLQTATLAERAGADEEVVVAALCHDIGKAISVPNHPEIAAAILKPYVRPRSTR